MCLGISEPPTAPPRWALPRGRPRRPPGRRPPSETGTRAGDAVWCACVCVVWVGCGCLGPPRGVHADRATDGGCKWERLRRQAAGIGAARTVGAAREETRAAAPPRPTAVRLPPTPASISMRTPAGRRPCLSWPLERIRRAAVSSGEAACAKPPPRSPAPPAGAPPARRDSGPVQTEARGSIWQSRRERRTGATRRT
eukprot:scaffold17988_cov136-Isochrysis_galbana.AAC.2